MKPYQNILVALDTSDEARQVLERTMDLARHYQAKLTVIHVIEPIVVENSYGLLMGIPLELEASLKDRAREFLNKIAADLQLDKAATLLVKMGSIKSEILSIASEQDVDMIVLGSHGRHGISLLMGSTANAVLHGSQCDTHVVRIRNVE